MDQPSETMWWRISSSTWSSSPSLQQGGPQQRPAGQVERAPGLVVGQPPGAPAPAPRRAGCADRRPAGARPPRLRSPGPGCRPRPGSGCGATRAGSPPRRGRGPAPGVQRAPQAQRGRQWYTARPGAALLEEPEALLGERERQRRVPGDPLDGRRSGGPGLPEQDEDLVLVGGDLGAHLGGQIPFGGAEPQPVALHPDPDVALAEIVAEAPRYSKARDPVVFAGGGWKGRLGHPAQVSISRANSPIVVASNRERSGSSTPKASVIREVTRVASSEWPPSSKKLSVTPTRSTPEHLAPDPRQAPPRPRCGARRSAPLARRRLRCRQRPAVDLAVGRERQRGERARRPTAPCARGSFAARYCRSSPTAVAPSAVTT